MKDFLFITDFDGTVTAQDFFMQIVYRYDREKLFVENKKRGFLLLKEVFDKAKLKEEQFYKEVEDVPIDPGFSSFCGFVKNIGGRVLILSVGSKLYIEKKLKQQGIEDANIVANGGIFDGGVFKFLKNEDKRFYSDEFGIDKLAVVRYYKKFYDKIMYAGDSYVDFDACRISDVIFAKKNLSKILKMFHIDFYEFENFGYVEKVVKSLFFDR